MLGPDFGDDIGGWQGNVFGVDGDLVCIDCDSTTLFNCPEEYIKRSEEDGVDWEQIYLAIDAVESVPNTESNPGKSCSKSSHSLLTTLFCKFRF